MKAAATAIGEKLTKLGFDAVDYAFGAAIIVFAKAGRSVEWAHRMVDETYKRLPGGGRQARAEGSRGQPISASTRQPVEDGAGRAPVAGRGPFLNARPSSSELASGGRDVVADHGLQAIAPVREPSPTQNRVAAEVRKVVSISVLDTFKMRDGRPIGDVRVGELERLRAANSMEASIIRQIQQIGVADHNMRVRDIVKPSEFQRIQQRAAEESNAA